MRRLLLPLLLAIAFTAMPSARSPIPDQDTCRAATPPPSRDPNIFTAEQERQFGDGLAERYEPYLTILEDDALTGPLREVGARLAARLPPGSIPVQFKLLDAPDTNAFALPGGRIFVTRKLVGLTRSEDELAGVLAHELGHVIAREFSVALTRQFREVLGVTAVGDRPDILAKYDRLMDNAARKPKLFGARGHEDANQIEADRIGLFIAAAAGYDPNAHATFFDRLAGTRGDTGGFFSRFFGTTNPDAKRLREIQRRAAVMPSGCADRVSPAPDRYRAWQLAVSKADITGGVESLPGLAKRTPLGVFRDQAQHVRFSLDGRYVLAQDDTGITVLDREPMVVRFRIPVNAAQPAAFTPDSQSVIFHTPDLRVERWSVQTGAAVAVRDVYWPAPCLATALAPTGRAAACVDIDGHLTLLDVESGGQIAQRRGFYRISGGDVMWLLLRVFSNTRTSGDLSMQFSPGGRYLAAGYTGYMDSGAYLYDLEQNVALNLRDPAKRLLGGTFAFLPDERLVGLNSRDPKRSGIVQLPGGQVAELPLPAAAIEGTADPRFLIVRPHDRFAVGLFDLQRQTVVTGLDSNAADVFDGQYATERGVAHLGLYGLAGAQLRTSAELPATRLPAARTGAISSDFRWLALSARGRAAMWDLSRGERIAYFQDFDGSFMEPDGTLFVDLPSSGTQPRTVARFDLKTRALAGTGAINSEYARQYGPWLLLRRHRLALLEAPGVEYQVTDVRKPAQGWTKNFERYGPDDYWFHPESDALALIWSANDAGGRDRLRQDPGLRKTVDTGDLAGDYLIEIIDAASGTLRARRVLETGRGSFRLLGVLVRGDRLFVSDSLNRVLAYSLSTGELKGYVFGSNPIISADGRRFAVTTGTGRLAVFQADTLARVNEFRFRTDVPFAALNADGSRLLAVTADQLAIEIDLGQGATAPTAADRGGRSRTRR